MLLQLMCSSIKFFFWDYDLQQADAWASSHGAMVESVMKASCEVIEFGWSKDRAPIDTFVMGLVASVRERNDYNEQVG